LRTLQREHPLPWRFCTLPVCASTERKLDDWLQAGAHPPLLVLAQHQRFGQGQQGRIWHAPRGGVWFSAALPWPADQRSSASLALAATLGLALELEGLGLSPQIKWPNDLLLSGRKVAGILPRLRWRGQRVRFAQLGVGFNVLNRVPLGGINLDSRLAPRRLRLEHWAARMVRALEWTAAVAKQPELVRRQVEKRLWRPESIEHMGHLWQVAGLTITGGLRLQRGAEVTVLHRHF